MFHRYHRIDRDQIWCDLLNTAFVSSPSSTMLLIFMLNILVISPMYQTNMHRLKPNVEPKLSDAVWITPQYREHAEGIWRKNPSPFNAPKLRRQISKCNAIINKAKGNFYTNIVNNNLNDSKWLWKELNVCRTHADL